MLEIGLKLEGLYRHASTHAAGIVIGDRPLEELVPLYRDPRSPLPATQFNMKYVEKAGLVKFDFLGLKTLTVIDKAQKLIRLRVPDFDANKIPLDDATTYQMLAQGDTVGVFQLESSGMRDAVRRCAPTASRTSSRSSRSIARVRWPTSRVYCARKLGTRAHRIPASAARADPEGDLRRHHLSGAGAADRQGSRRAIRWREADLLRRAMGKKIKSEMDAQRERFLKGAIERGIERRHRFD